MGYEFFGEKIIFPSAPVPGINNDQSLIASQLALKFLDNRLIKFPLSIFVRSHFPERASALDSKDVPARDLVVGI